MRTRFLSVLAIAALPTLLRGHSLIEAQAPFSMLRVPSVAGKALAGKNRPDVALVAGLRAVICEQRLRLARLHNDAEDEQAVPGFHLR